MENLNLTAKQMDFVTDAFLEHGKLIKQIARKFANKQFDTTDIESYLNERFTKIALSYDPTKSSNLGGYLNYWLTKRAENFLNSAEAGYAKVNRTFSALNEGGNGEDKPMFEETKLTNGIHLETEIHRDKHITETLDCLFANATPLQQEIMNAYLNAEGKASYTEIGKVVGKHHETVKRELKKLAKLADFDFTILEQPQFATPRQRN